MLIVQTSVHTFYSIEEAHTHTLGLLLNGQWLQAHNLLVRLLVSYWTLVNSGERFPQTMATRSQCMCSQGWCCILGRATALLLVCRLALSGIVYGHPNTPICTCLIQSTTHTISVIIYYFIFICTRSSRHYLLLHVSYFVLTWTKGVVTCA